MEKEEAIKLLEEITKNNPQVVESYLDIRNREKYEVNRTSPEYKTLTEIVADFRKTKDEDLFRALLKIDSRFFNRLINSYTIGHICQPGFQELAILANPSIILEANNCFSSTSLTYLKESWSNRCDTPLSEELSICLDRAIELKKMQEEAAMKRKQAAIQHASTNNRTSATYSSEVRRQAPRYVQKGGAITTGPVYGGRNQQL